MIKKQFGKLISTALLLLISNFLFAQLVLDAGKVSANYNDTTKTSSFEVEGVKSDLYINQTDSSTVYTLDLKFDDAGERRIYLTIDKSGLVQRVFIIEKRFDTYEIVLNKEERKIEAINFNFW